MWSQPHGRQAERDPSVCYGAQRAPAWNWGEDLLARGALHRGPFPALHTSVLPVCGRDTQKEMGRGSGRLRLHGVGVSGLGVKVRGREHRASPLWAQDQWPCGPLFPRLCPFMSRQEPLPLPLSLGFLEAPHGVLSPEPGLMGPRAEAQDRAFPCVCP